MRQAVEAQVVTPPFELGEQGLRQILSDVIEEVRRSVSQDIDGAEVLHSLLTASWLQSLLKVYECLQRYLTDCPAPALDFASGLSLQLLIDIRSLPYCSEEAKELYRLLRQPHMQALLSAHDTVAQKDYEPVLPPMPDELPDDEEATRIVCLVKNKQPLGATIKRNDITGEIFVARVIHGGLADRSGLLHAGDRIIEVNGFPVDGMEPEQVIQVVQARSHGTIMFKVIPITERPIHNQTMLYVRAMTDYSPQQDPTIPCADAGMSFKKGDILEIVDQTDALWWQAKKLPGSSACAGLIPSTSLLKRKQREFWWSQPYQPHVCMQILSTVDEEEDLMAIDERCVEADEEAFESEELREEVDDFSSNIEGVYLAGFRRSIRLCRRRSQSTTQPSSHIRCPSSCSSLPNNPYEEVVRYQRHPEDTHRVIALIGSSGVGVNELRRRLIEMSPNIFQGAIPHATRSPRGYEESGREYYFTSREIFDHMISNNRFLEFGEYKGNLYGTSIDAVKDVLNSGKICVVDIEPNVVQAVRTHELRAYIIYVKPPPLERLRETRQDSYITTNYYVNRPFKDEDFHEMEESARKIEAQYWQFFDQVIVNDELQDSCVQLLTAVRKAQDEPQWVPACWIRPTAES
ncbi:MAGUK p55 subfamily member 4 isoform X1 [Xiphophorus maculatus]|uniref:MAGUK p55 subfamily member 4 isoform X1 n=1 Tax=Xiphophorus maculatus TaxID=8083 RepID=UPI0006D92E9C|nr:MAGUK p55 subfamily member 4 isoform X1 [Xiphophorus maculatus]XP_023184981.1 MAGUK p55 subfamily member 4 isoform X1 [Xiphophorus maculatus]XP_023184982.1 MAGUK p55 subfamily member 4 isoform X1 [Xiphophorus maculatus]